MNFVKSFLTLAAMTLIVVGLSGNTCIWTPNCSAITDQGGCALPICAWTGANVCVPANTTTCGANANLTAAATGDCSVAATDSTSCADVTIQNGPSGTPTSVCSFTSGTASCVPNIGNEATACPTLANTCTVNATSEATACAAFSTDTTCNANNPFCAWDGTTCIAASPGTCTVNVTNEATACNGIYDADRCVQNNGAFCIWDNNTGLCGPRSTSAPSSGQDFNACAAAATGAICAGILVNGTSVCTASNTQFGSDAAACTAANTSSTACTGLVVGSTQVCDFVASTCATGGNANFCTETSPTQCDPKSSAQPGTGDDVTTCAAAATSSGACAAVTVGGTSVCDYFADTCSVNTTAGVVADACAGISVTYCASGLAADFCQYNSL